jgi:hypothetical protein
VLTALAVAIIAAACSGGGEKEDVATGSTTTTAPTVPDTEVSTTEVPTVTTLVGEPDTVPPQPEPTAPPRQPRKIAYPTGGPKGPVYPPGHPAYELFTSQRCDELLANAESWESSYSDVPSHQIHLYRAAANACLSNWEAAVADFDRLGPLQGDFSEGCHPEDPNVQPCPSCDRAVLAWLTEVMDAYKSEPDLPPVLTGTAGAPPC